VIAASGDVTDARSQSRHVTVQFKGNRPVATAHNGHGAGLKTVADAVGSAIPSLRSGHGLCIPVVSLQGRTSVFGRTGGS